MPAGRPRNAHSAVHVRVDGRLFIVEFNVDDEVLRIKERKENPFKPMGVSIGVYDTSYWCASSHVLGTGNTIPKRVIAAARVKHGCLDAAS